MSTEMRLARLGLLHLIDNPESLKSALKEKAKLLRNNHQLQSSDITLYIYNKKQTIKPPNRENKAP